MAKRSLLRSILILGLLIPASSARALYDADLSQSLPAVSAKTTEVARLAPETEKPIAQMVNVAPDAPAYSADWSATTPAFNQGGLLGGYACAPTSLAMITSHYSSRYAVDSRTTQEFIDNLRPGEFVPGEGAPYQKLARQLVELGYKNITGHTGAAKAELQQRLAQGPMIITAGGTVAGARASHSLVVTAVSNDGSWVKLNDPADGRNHTVSWSRFDSLWSGGSRGVLVALP